MTDEYLMLQVYNGNLNAASILYERYKSPIFNFFRKFGIDRELCQDHTQLVFERLLRYRHTFKNENLFKPWIYRIARNINNDYFQKNKAIKVDLSEAENYSNEDSSNVDEQTFILKKALEKLTYVQREILVLSKYEDLKYEQIASMLDISVSAVKVRVFRALKELKKVYFEIVEKYEN